MRVLLSGYYGFGNVGDEALLRIIVQRIRARMPKVEIEALSASPEATSAQYGIRATQRRDAGAVRAAMERADALISGGGGLLQNATSTRSLLYYAGIIRAAHRRKKKTMIFAQSVGPLDGLGKFLVRTLCSGVDRATVRDRRSRELLQSLLPATKVEQSADPVFLLDLAPDERDVRNEGLDPVGAPYVVVSVRKHQALRAGIPAIARAVDLLSREYGFRGVFLPMGGAEDADVATRVIRACESAPMLLPERSIERSAAIVASARAVIGMRLHALIFAARFAVPFLAIPYDPKVAALCEDLAYPLAPLWVPGGTVPDNAAIDASVGRLMSEHERLREHLQGAVLALRAGAERNFEILQDLLDE